MPAIQSPGAAAKQSPGPAKQSPAATASKPLCTGAHAPAADRATVERMAALAAMRGVPLSVACPYADGTDAALHFAAVWFLLRDADVPLHPRPPASVVNEQAAAARLAGQRPLQLEDFFTVHR